MHVFELLADPTRRRIVELLAHRELPVVLLAERLGADRDASFVEVRIDSPQRLYRLSWNAMDRLDAAVEELWLIWENRVGWPYAVVPADESPERLHRVGRRGLRGRTRSQIEPRGEGGDWFSYFSD